MNRFVVIFTLLLSVFAGINYKNQKIQPPSGLENQLENSFADDFEIVDPIDSGNPDYDTFTQEPADHEKFTKEPADYDIGQEPADHEKFTKQPADYDITQEPAVQDSTLSAPDFTQDSTLSAPDFTTLTDMQRYFINSMADQSPTLQQSLDPVLRTASLPYTYSLVTSLHAVYGSTLGIVSSSCVAYNQGLNVQQAAGLGCKTSLISFLVGVHSKIIVSGISTVAIGMIAACSRDNKCTESAKEFVGLIQEIVSPIVSCSLGGVVACWANGDNAAKGAINGAVSGVFQALFWPFRDRLYYIDRNSGKISIPYTVMRKTISTLFLVAGSVAASYSIGQKWQVGFINGLFDVPNLNAIELNKGVKI